MKQCLVVVTTSIAIKIFKIVYIPDVFFFFDFWAMQQLFLLLLAAEVWHASGELAIIKQKRWKLFFQRALGWNLKFNCFLTNV